MDVQLYVYDLSRGLARQMSLGFLGVQIDAVYHTALVFGGVEYFFGAGVQTCIPGSTHHGRPMEIVNLGRTELPIEVILEYLDSLRKIYTAESYDLFAHNCNNFSNDFSMFLLGKGIPAHITSLPQTVLNTPFGQMLKPQLDQALRGVTQAPVPQANIPSRAAANGVNGSAKARPALAADDTGKVRSVTTMREVHSLLEEAKNSCAVVFFTSATCPPCKICYGPYDNLAEEFAGKVTLIKVDLSIVHDVDDSFKIPGTPNFIAYLKGEKFEQWSGADIAKLTSTVKLLVQMAHPPHPHMTIRAPTLQKPYRPSLYQAVPPLEKLVTKLDKLGQEPEVQSLKTFVAKRQNRDSAADATVPDLAALSKFLRKQIDAGYTDSLFALIDLLRVAVIDPRISGYLIQDGSKDSSSSCWALIDAVCGWDNAASAATRLVTVQFACNLFSSPLLTKHLNKGAESLTRLSTWLLLDEDSSTKVHECAATLIHNTAAAVHSQRLDGHEENLPESNQIELVVCLLECLQRNEEAEVLKRSTLSLGLIAFLSRQDGEVRSLLADMDATGTIQNSEALKTVVEKKVLDDVVKVVS